MAKAPKTKKKRNYSLLLASLASGVLYALAFPPLNLFFLVFVALVPWLVALQKANTFGGFKSGYWFGLVFWGTQMFWLIPFVQKWTGSVWTALIPYVLILALMPLVFAVAGIALQKCVATGRTWLIPLVWAGMEWGRSTVPYFKFPWGLIALPMANYPRLIQHAALGTIFFVSAWVVLVNVILLDIARQAKPLVVFRSLLIAVGLGFGSAWYYNLMPATKTMSVGAGQPGVDLAFGDKATTKLETVKRVQSLYDQANARGLDLVVFPEAMFDVKEPEDVKSVLSIGQTPIVVGATRLSTPPHQSSFAVADGHVADSDKTELVIFGEYVPLRNSLPFLNQFNLPSGDLVPGEAPKVLSAGKVRVGPMLCFEALFPHVGCSMADHGAQILAVQSIDDWYRGTWAPEQLELSARFRAAESQLPVIRAASTGTSMLISMKGTPFAMGAGNAETLVAGQMFVPDHSVAFAGREYFGWLGGACWLVALVMPLPKKKTPS